MPSPPPKPVLGFPDSEVTNGSIFSTTKVPCPGRVATRPRLMSHLIASLTVFREASYSSRSSSSVGSWPAGRDRPRFDLLPQIFGDLPVHRVSHWPSSRPYRFWSGSFYMSQPLDLMGLYPSSRELFLGSPPEVGMSLALPALGRTPMIWLVGYR